MVEPRSGFVKDCEGWTWFRDEKGWTLLHHENMLCYANVPFPRIEKEYGPLRSLDSYELHTLGAK